MKLTQKQAMQLVILLQSSLSKNILGYLCYNVDDRALLLSNIMNQQDDETLVDLDDHLVR